MRQQRMKVMIGLTARYSFQSTRTQRRELGSKADEMDANTTVDDKERKWTG